MSWRSGDPAIGDRPAIVSGGRTYSYSELDRAADRIASNLIARDLQVRVAFFVAPSFEWTAVALGIWRAGGIAVPLAQSYPPAELDYVIRDAEASCVVADDVSMDQLGPIAHSAGVQALAVGTLLEKAERHPGLPSVARERRALILYTSGTTGKPKGVVTTHANIEAQTVALLSAWGWTAADRALLVLPLHHVHGIINVVCSSLAAGAVCEMHPRFDAEAAWARLASGELTLFTAVPTIYHRLIASWDAAPPAVQRERSDGCRRLRLMMSGSAALPVSTLERWREISGHTLLERYGMTEIGMGLSNPLRGERRPGFVGVPLPEVDAQVVDEAGRPVEAGGAGELEIRGPGVFHEYWRKPEATREAFRGGWFRTGDVAVVEHGAYRLLGRTSVDIIKTGGYKISALEIEDVLRGHPAVADCAVVGVADAEWGERVCVAVEVRAGAALVLTELQAWAKPLLAPYKIPRGLRVVAALPRNAMGKVVKKDVAGLGYP